MNIYYRLKTYSLRYRNTINKFFLVTLMISFFSFDVFCSGFGIGSDSAFPKIAEVLKAIPIKQNELYYCSDEDVLKLISTAADIEINVFELLDCIYRYLSQHKMRIEIKGRSLQKLLNDFDFGKERIMALLPIDLIVKIQMGILLDNTQKVLQIYLNKVYENYIEIGTAVYDTEFGFLSLEPHLFLDSYGMYVKKFGIKRPIKKIYLYENGKGAIYASGFVKPKRWNLWLITYKK